MSKNVIVGAWSLVTYTMKLEGSKAVFYPYGENPLGILIYTMHDVSVHIMRSNRSEKNGMPEAQIESAENYGGYVGSYEIQGNNIIHYPKVSSFINFINVLQIRKFKIKDDILILEYYFFNKDYKKNGHAHLVWQQVTR